MARQPGSASWRQRKRSRGPRRAAAAGFNPEALPPVATASRAAFAYGQNSSSNNANEDVYEAHKRALSNAWRNPARSPGMAMTARPLALVRPLDDRIAAGFEDGATSDSIRQLSDFGFVRADLIGEVEAASVAAGEAFDAARQRARPEAVAGPRRRGSSRDG
jgi:hypothetical protein